MAVVDQALKFPLSVGEDDGGAQNGREDYGHLVAAQLKALRERAGLTSEAMATALSEELGRSIKLPAVSRWENGHQMPRSDVLIAAMRVAGLPQPSEGARDARRALEIELQNLRRQVEMLSRRMNHEDKLPILPESQRQVGSYLTVAESAKRLGVSRETLYARIRAKQLPAYVWMGRTVLTVRDLDRSTG